MQRKKVFSVITIICFASVIFIPIGLVLMFYFTDWPKKRKIILSATMTVLYIVPVVVLSNIGPGTKVNQGSVVESVAGEKGLTIGGVNSDAEKSELPSTIEKYNRRKVNRWVYPLIFVILMVCLIVLQNFRSSKKEQEYDNPYVDVGKYKLPLKEGATLPLVHFPKLELQKDEEVLYASKTVQTDNEGDFAITNKRIVIYDKESTVSYKLKEITIASSISDTVMFVASGNEKNYIFLPDGQMKYALGVIRYAYNSFK